MFTSVNIPINGVGFKLECTRKTFHRSMYGVMTNKGNNKEICYAAMTLKCDKKALSESTTSYGILLYVIDHTYIHTNIIVKHTKNANRNTTGSP